MLGFQGFRVVGFSVLRIQGLMVVGFSVFGLRA